MIKNAAFKKIIISTIALLILFIIYILPSPKQDAEGEILYTPKKTIVVYAIDKNNYVSRINVSYENEDEIPYLISILTIDNIYTNIIPNNFFPIIPKNTKLLSYEIKDKILSLNFSKDFLNMTKENERKTIESLIFTLCELDGIKGIKIYINNMPLTNLPNSNETLPEIFDRNFGINKKFHLNNLKDTTQTTVYYIGKDNKENYYIPITHITNDDNQKIEIIVNELTSTSLIDPNLSSYLNASYELKDYEILENSIHLSFSSPLLTSLNTKDIKEEVTYLLTLSIRDTYDIEDITIDLN